MKKVAICFTKDGKKVIEKLNQAAMDKGIEPAKAYICHGDLESCAGFVKVTEPLEKWTSERFAEHARILFVGAVGIAVRAISPFVKDKLTDSAVIVIDDLGRFVIPILGGHAGGANKTAVMIARLIDAVPVITTSTDSHEAFAADVFAGEYGLKIRNRDGIKKVSARAIEGKRVTLSIKDYPPKEPVDVIIADETDREYGLLLSPGRYTLGLGMKRGKDASEAEAFILSVLKDHRIDPDELYAVCTLDRKEQEPAIRSFCDRYRLPLITFDAPLLRKAKGSFASSEFVEKTVGVDNVCERAAVLGAGPGAELVVRKQSGQGITAACALRKFSVTAQVEKFAGQTD